MQNLYTKISLGTIVAFLLYIVVWYNPVGSEGVNQSKFTWDANGYYSYLPATFLYKDLRNFAYTNYIEAKYHTPPGYITIKGQKIIQYSCGQAVMEAPWFALGHFMAKLTKDGDDGYSMSYQVPMEWGMLLWCLLGIFVLANLLLRYFDDKTVAITLFCLTIGTNYYPYATVLNTYTHSPLFTVYALLLSATLRFYQHITMKNAAWLGVWVGLAVLTRPTEAIAVLIPVLWGVYDKDTFLERIVLIKANLLKLAVAVAITLLIGSLQLVYWKYVTGHFLFYSYDDQTFSFLKPHLYTCFFSSRKGWLTYTPMVLVALLGFYTLWRSSSMQTSFVHLKPHRFLLSVFAFLSIWITFSWDIWWYGGGIGQRAMIQYLPIFAFSFAAFTQEIIEHSPLKWVKWVLGGFMILSFYHNIWVFHGSMKGGYIFTGDCNDAYFFKTFWKWSPPTPDEERLLDNPENNLVLNTPKLIYKNDFEQDTSSNHLDNGFNGTKCIQISKELQYSKPYTIDIASSEAIKKIAATATFQIKNRDWGLWTVPVAQLQVKKNGKVIKSNFVHLHRQTNDGDIVKIGWTAYAPSESFDQIEVLFWNMDSHTTTLIDDLSIETSAN